MHTSYRCRFCGPVQVNEAELGGSVYCPQCGREVDASDHSAMPVVAASSPTQVASHVSQNRVFSNCHAAQLEIIAIGEAVCPCGRHVPYALADIGNTVYCPGCGHEVYIGDSLTVPTQRLIQAEQEQQNVNPLTVHAIRQRSWSMYAVILVIAVGAMGILLLFRPKETQPTIAEAVNGQPVRDHSSSPRGVVEGGASADPPHVEEEPLSADKITLADIQALLKLRDPRAVLWEARFWQQLLTEDAVPENDPRQLALKEVIATCLQRLTPPGQPRPELMEIFRQLLAETRRAIKDQRWPDARDSYDRAQRLYEEHVEELRSFSRSLTLLGAQIRQWEWERDGMARLLAMLTQAREFAEQGDVTSAWERRAIAGRLAEVAIALSDADRERVKRESATLRDALRFSTGKRAVEDAQRCQEAKDATMRNELLKIAFQQLPGLPEEKITSLMTTARELQKQSLTGKSSPLGRQLELRGRYERFLEQSTQGLSGDLGTKCRDLWRQVQAEPSLGQDWRSDRIRETVYELVEPRFQLILSAAQPTAETLIAIVEARQTLTSLSDWQDEPRWKALAASVSQLCDDWGKQLSRTAEELVQANQYERAQDLLKSASGLQSAELDAMHRRIQDEVALRADRKAEADEWVRVSALQQAGNVAEWGRAVEQFLRRYANSTHRENALQAKVQVIEKLRPESIQMEEIARKSWAEKKYGEYLSHVHELLSSPFVNDVVPDAEVFRKHLSELEQRVDLLLQVALKNRRLASEDEILAARTTLKELMSIQPEHAEARKLLTAVEGTARQMAEQELKKATLYRKRLPAKSRLMLQSVMRLDPDGPLGEQARAMAKDLN